MTRPFHRWAKPRRGDIVAITLIAALLVLFFIINVVSSGRSLPFNFGFGPEMECHPMGDGDPVCIKKR
jgi:hypothetical protein